MVWNQSQVILKMANNVSFSDPRLAWTVGVETDFKQELIQDLLGLWTKVIVLFSNDVTVATLFSQPIRSIKFICMAAAHVIKRLESSWNPEITGEDFAEKIHPVFCYGLVRGQPAI